MGTHGARNRSEGTSMIQSTMIMMQPRVIRYIYISYIYIYIYIFSFDMPSRGLNNQSSPEIVHGCPWVDDANTCNQYPTSPAGRLAVFLQCQTARHHCAQRSLDGLGGSRLLNKREKHLHTHIHIQYTSIFTV